MTQYPPPHQPVPYGYPGGAPMGAQKPGSITTLAILAIIIGGLGMLCCGITGLGGALVAKMGGNTVQMPDGTKIQQDPKIALVNGVIGTVDLVACTILLVCGIGALSLKPWARQWAIYVSGVIIVSALARVTAQVLWIGPATAEMFRLMESKATTQPNAPNMPQLSGMVGAFSAGWGVVFFIIEAIVPVLILLIWTKPHIKAWFDNADVLNQPLRPQY